MSLYNDDVLFIHIPKTAGKSVKRALIDNLPGARMAPAGGYDLRDDQIDSRFPLGHIPLKDIERFIGRPPDSFKLIVAVIRNPYEQQLSQWQYWRDRYARGGRHVHDVVSASYPSLSPWLMDPRCDFHLWYESVHGISDAKPFHELSEAYGFFGYRSAGNSYYRYWVDVEGRVPTNVKLVRYESLDEGLNAVLEPFVEGPFELPRLNVNVANRREDWAEYYTPYGARIVEEKFRWTFDLGAYPRLNYQLDDVRAVIA